MKVVIITGSRNSLGYFAEVIEGGRAKYSPMGPDRQTVLRKAIDFAVNSLQADEILFDDKDFRCDPSPTS